jgi:DNA-binding transcriptional LysR family regulator
LCQLPDYYVLEHLHSGALISLLEAHQPPNTAVWALYPQQRHLSPKVRKLVDYEGRPSGRRIGGKGREGARDRSQRRLAQR